MLSPFGLTLFSLALVALTLISLTLVRLTPLGLALFGLRGLRLARDGLAFSGATVVESALLLRSGGDWQQQKHRKQR